MQAEQKLKKEVISIFVDNQANVLTRVVSLFGRRGFNIESLTVSATNNPDISRITIVFLGTEQGLYQIISQTEKLEVVKAIFTLSRESSIFRELLLVKVVVDNNLTSIREIVDIFRGNIVDLSNGSMVIELTGAPDKINAFMNMIDKYEVTEMCRTGVTGIQRGGATANFD